MHPIKFSIADSSRYQATIQPERQVLPLNINTQQLRYFMELAKCLNFTRAAANLYVAQPTLSQQIADLEAQLGVPLFVRSSRSVSLTPAGKILYAAYPKIDAQVRQVQHHMLVTAAGFSGSLTIGFADVVMDLVPPIMRNFRSAFPDIALKPVSGSPNELIEGLKNHTIDVAFSLIQAPDAEERPPFLTKTLLRDSLCFVLSQEHPAPSDYFFTSSLPLISFSESFDSFCHPHVAATLKKLGLSVPKTIFADAAGTIRAYLESGTGFSVLPQRYSPFFSAATQFIPIPGEHLEFGALWDAASANPALPLFLDALDPHSDPSAPPA